MARRYEVTDEEWVRIRDHIPTAKTGRPPKDHRQMLNAMVQKRMLMQISLSFPRRPITTQSRTTLTRLLSSLSLRLL